MDTMINFNKVTLLTDIETWLVCSHVLAIQQLSINAAGMNLPQINSLWRAWKANDKTFEEASVSKLQGKKE